MNPSGALLTPTPRTTVRRHAERGSHERALIDAILDEALLCHLGVSIDGVPRVLPTAHVRIGDDVYLHGARANRVLSAACSSPSVCVTVTLLDGLVFSRSAFSHSMNYRSVMLYGTATEVTDPGHQRAVLDALVDHMAQGRSQETRAPTDEELRSTLVVRIPIAEGSAKVRKGPPLDAREPNDGHCWAGELPLRLSPLLPVPDPTLPTDVPVAAAVRRQIATLQAASHAPYQRARGPYSVDADPRRIDFAFVHRYLAEESYWAKGVEAAVQRRAMDHALCFGMYDAETQIGFARVVTDYGRLAYLGDVFVTERARGLGLGKWLVECVLAHPALQGVERWLLGTADAHSLYTRFGFVPAENGRYMVRRAED
jgi:nitroimidazol reductase NimA-like FMN-containing flavoprotein (pyridoxamine 5'-phosphate oxidase superfamily)/GNAT superfamily N-acetyltransferase